MNFDGNNVDNMAEWERGARRGRGKGEAACVESDLFGSLRLAHGKHR